MPRYNVKTINGVKTLVDYSRPQLLDASDITYGNSDVESELDEINSNLSVLVEIPRADFTWSSGAVCFQASWSVPVGKTLVGFICHIVGNYSINGYQYDDSTVRVFGFTMAGTSISNTADFTCYAILK